jgi:hypothetical protein
MHLSPMRLQPHQPRRQARRRAGRSGRHTRARAGSVPLGRPPGRRRRSPCRDHPRDVSLSQAPLAPHWLVCASRRSGPPRSCCRSSSTGRRTSERLTGACLHERACKAGVATFTGSAGKAMKDWRDRCRSRARSCGIGTGQRSSVRQRSLSGPRGTGEHRGRSWAWVARRGEPVVPPQQGRSLKRAGGFLYQNELAGFVKSRYCKEVRPGDAMCVNCQIRRIEDQKDRK